jgi:hypothetical protein
MAQYERIGSSIQRGNITLALQHRIDLTPILRCLCWRERRNGSNTNRRFYLEQGAYWSMPSSQALDMMRQAKQQGWFDDPGAHRAEISESSLISPNSEESRRVLVNSIHDDEWTDSSGVLCLESDHRCRKVMLLSRDKRKVTFRSLTSREDYTFTYRETSADGWKLDRAMLDAHPTAFTHFLEYLDSIPLPP